MNPVKKKNTLIKKIFKKYITIIVIINNKENFLFLKCKGIKCSLYFLVYSFYNCKRIIC